MARSVHNLLHATAWSLLLVPLQACRLAQPVPPARVMDPCVLVDDDARSIRVALSMPVHRDSILRARSPVESLVATQLVETLVHLDCTGVVRPALATSWSDSAGIIWEFALRRDARSAEDTPLEAAAVLRGWTNDAHPMSPLFASLTATSAHALRVELREPARLHLFADPLLGAATAGPGAWRLAAEEPLTLASVSGRTLTLLPYTGDSRRAIEENVDALVTADADVVAYGARAGYSTTPLPWSRTYILATGGVRQDPRIPEEIGGALARDVVRQNARAAESPFWWEPAPCGLAGVRFRSHDEARDIVYPRGDAVARALAERIAALAWPVGAAPGWLRELLPAAYGAAGAPRAVALDEASLIRSLRAHLPLAAIVPLPRVHDRECTAAAASAAPTLLSAGWQITALVDARDVLLHRPGVGRVTADGFGTIRFSPH